jgi:hypothetical protein
VPEPVFDLFAEYAGAYTRGESPQAQAYLERAGAGADELAQLLEAFLTAAPRPAASADAVALVSAWAEGEPPLVHLRASHGVRVDDVVEAIVNETGLAASTRAKVKGYYQRLEEGFLAPDGVSERVWNVLRRVISPLAEAAAAWSTPVVADDAAYFRATGIPVVGSAVTAPPDATRDQVDELFTSGR